MEATFEKTSLPPSGVRARLAKLVAKCRASMLNWQNNFRGRRHPTTIVGVSTREVYEGPAAISLTPDSPLRCAHQSAARAIPP